MDKSKLNFRAGNPGAVQFGNFINYYQFHPPENRLKLLPENIWTKDGQFYGLDLGCNTGDLTFSLYNFLSSRTTSCKILGIDIDPTLIQRAQEKSADHTNVTFQCADFMDESTRKDIGNDLKEKSLPRFSAIFCFSITMWIHLNHGDDGLRTFLREISNLGELIVIEAQPWKCYRCAVKRLKLSGDQFPLFPGLKMRQSVEKDIEQFLTDHCDLAKIYESSPTDWDRKLLIFKHKS